MKTRFLFALLSFATSATVGAQQPSTGVGRTPEGAPAAKLLLSNTGELGLTDQQVVRLAGIARREEARRSALRAAMDSARGRYMQPGDSMARRQFGERMRGEAERARTQMQADQRDAIAVLTPDQQAKAWAMVSNRGRDMQRGARGMGRDMQRGPRGMGRDMQRGPRGMGRDMRRGMRARSPMLRQEPGDRPMRLRQPERVPAPAPRPPDSQ